MKILARVPVKYILNKFQVDIEYATSEKISIFSLVILEILKKYNERKKIVEDVLLELSFSKELHYLFEKEIAELISSNTILLDDTITSNFVKYPIHFFSLTEKGEKVYLSKERVSKIFSENLNLGLDIFSNTVLKEIEIEKKQNKTKFAILIENNDTINDKHKILNTIKNSATKFIKNHFTSKTEIQDISFSYIGKTELGDSIDLVLKNNIVIFTHKNQKLLDAFLKKKKTRELENIFPLIKLTNNEINISNAKVYYGEKTEMEAVLTSSIQANNFIDSTNIHLSLTELRIKSTYFQFIGLNKNKEYIVFKYSVLNIENYKIPFVEILKNSTTYDSYINSIIEDYLLNFENEENYDIILKLLILIRPQNKEYFINRIIQLFPSDNKIAFLKQLNGKYKTEFKNIITQIATQIINDLIKNQESSINKIIDIAVDFQVSPKSYFGEIKNNIKFTNALINQMIEVDEEEADKVFNLGEIYFNFLIKNNFKEIFTGKIFSNFKLFSEIINQLDYEFGIINFDISNLPKTEDKWKNLYKNIKYLQVIFDKIQLNLPQNYKNKVNNFIENIVDIFYESQTVEITDNTNVDIDTYFKKIINHNNPDWIALAARLRIIIENEIKVREKKKNIAGLKGKERIKAVFTIPDEARQVYSIWRFLNLFLHDEVNKKNEFIRQDFIRNYRSIQKIILKKEKKFSENMNVFDISKKEATQQSDTTIFASNFNNKKFAVLEFSTKAVKLLIGPEKEIFEKNGFNPFDFQPHPRERSEFTETGKCLDKYNILNLDCFKNQVLPGIKKHIIRIKEHNINTVYSVATAAYRTAINRNDILRLIFNKTGINLRILPKQDEALATLIAFYFTKPQDYNLKEYTLLIDQGGGSTELSIFREQELLHSSSFDLGTTVLENIFFKEKNISFKEAFNNAKDYVSDRINKNFNTFLFSNIKDLSCVCVGTAITKATKKQNNKEQHGKILSLNKLKVTREEFIKSIENNYGNLNELFQDINNIKKKNNEYRKMLTSIIGLPFFIEIMQELEIKEIIVSGTGLWYGIYFQKLYNIQ